MTDQTPLVASTKAELEARGVSLAGPCGAFEITKRVAWALRDQGAGLLDKPGGNNCNGYATDYVVFREGPSFDILSDGGGSNGPQWNQDDDPALLSRWRAPRDPGDVPVVTPVDPPPGPPATPPAPDAVLSALDRIERKVEALMVLEVQDTEKIQQQIDHVVTDIEKTAKSLAPLLKLFGR